MAKPENEIKKLHTALNDISSLARENKSVSKYGDMPTTFLQSYRKFAKLDNESKTKEE
jgi:hypothetical protein